MQVSWRPFVLLALCAHVLSTQASQTVLPGPLSTRLNAFRKHPAQIRGIELISTKPGGSIESRFGHLLLRVVDNDGDTLNDLVFNFYPDYSRCTPMLSMTPTCDLALEVQTMGAMVKSYAVDQRRGLERFTVITTAEMRMKLIHHLHYLTHNPNVRGKYTAMSNSCVGIIEDALRAAGAPIDDANVIRPAAVQGALKKVGLSPYPLVPIGATAQIDAGTVNNSRGLAAPLYEICSTDDCGRRVVEALRKGYGKYFSPQDLRATIQRRNAFGGSLPRHYDILERALGERGF